MTGNRCTATTLENKICKRNKSQGKYCIQHAKIYNAGQKGGYQSDDEDDWENLDVQTIEKKMAPVEVEQVPVYQPAKNVPVPTPMSPQERLLFGTTMTVQEIEERIRISDGEFDKNDIWVLTYLIIKKYLSVRHKPETCTGKQRVGWYAEQHKRLDKIVENAKGNQFLIDLVCWFNALMLKMEDVKLGAKTKKSIKYSTSDEKFDDMFASQGRGGDEGSHIAYRELGKEAYMRLVNSDFYTPIAHIMSNHAKRFVEVANSIARDLKVPIITNAPRRNYRK